jgi:hypothetical protein
MPAARSPLGALARGAAAGIALPAMRIYDKPWEYAPSTLAQDAGYNLVYGLTSPAPTGSSTARCSS